MKTYCTVLRALIKGSDLSLLLPTSARSKQKRSKWLGNLSTGLRWLLIAASVLWAYGFFGYIGYENANLPSFTPQTWIKVGTGLFLASLMFDLITFLPGVLQLLYTSRDRENLLVLPIRPVTVLAAQLSILSLAHLPMLFFWFTALFGVLIRKGLLLTRGWLLLGGILTLNFLMIALVGLVAVTLMRVIGSRINLERVTYISQTLAVVLIFAIALAGPNLITEGGVASLHLPEIPLVTWVMQLTFQPQLPVLKLLAYLGLWLTLMLLIGVFISRLYLTTQNQVRGRRSRKLSTKDWQKLQKSRSPIRAFNQVDRQRVTRCAAFMSNLYVPNLLYFLALLGGAGFGLYVLLTQPDPQATWQMIRSLGPNVMNDPAFLKVLAWLPLGACMVAFVFCTTSISMVNLSREGQDAMLLLSFPLDMKRLFWQKLWTDLKLSAPAWICFLILLGALMIINLPLAWIIWVLILFVLTSFSFKVVANLIDWYVPKLSWQTEQELIKMNFRGLFGLLIEALWLAGLGAILFMANKWLPNPVLWTPWLGLLWLGLAIMAELALVPVVVKRGLDHLSKNH